MLQSNAQISSKMSNLYPPIGLASSFPHQFHQPHDVGTAASAAFSQKITSFWKFFFLRDVSTSCCEYNGVWLPCLDARRYAPSSLLAQMPRVWRHFEGTICN